MRLLFVTLFLFSGCSVSKFYRSADVQRELKRNDTQLDLIAWTVEKDSSDNEAFYKNYQKDSKAKGSYLLEDLSWRLVELSKKKETILKLYQKLKQINHSLLSELGGREEIRESDAAYKRIEKFANLTGADVRLLFSEYASYKSASMDFANFSLFTGISWRRPAER